MSPHDSTPSPETGAQRRPGKRLWRRLSLLAGALVLIPGGISVGAIAFNNVFPTQEAASCTVENPGRQWGRRTLFQARLATDCGRFRSSTQVTCSSTPTRQLHLTQGVTYDLIVRGPRIPLLSTPEVVSAVVSDEQRDDALIEPTEVDPTAPKGLQDLQRAGLPETLRAFDYEQPAFDPSCDSERLVMTANGIQLVAPARAEQLLALPAGETPRDPLLPCEGYPCTQPG